MGTGALVICLTDLPGSRSQKGFGALVSIPVFSVIAVLTAFTVDHPLWLATSGDAAEFCAGDVCREWSADGRSRNNGAGYHGFYHWPSPASSTRIWLVYCFGWDLVLPSEFVSGLAISLSYAETSIGQD